MLQRGVDIRLSEAVPVRTRRITSLADGLQFQSRERVVAVMGKREGGRGRRGEEEEPPGDRFYRYGDNAGWGNDEGGKHEKEKGQNADIWQLATSVWLGGGQKGLLVAD